jgi:hypothetical protein
LKWNSNIIYQNSKEIKFLKIEIKTRIWVENYQPAKICIKVLKFAINRTLQYISFITVYRNTNWEDVIVQINYKVIILQK